MDKMQEKELSVMSTYHRSDSIQGLRALGVISVFMWHTHWYVDSVFKLTLTTYFRGDFANIMFFFLAGFFLGLTNIAEGFNVKAYVKKRISKVYGLYFLTVIACVLYSIYDSVLAKELLNWATLIKQFIPHLLLIQSWIPKYPYETSLNGPGWFLSTMLFFWIVSKPLICWCEKMGGKKRKLFVCVSACLIYAVIGWYFDKYNLKSIVPEIFRPVNVFPYIIGIMVGKIVRDGFALPNNILFDIGIPFTFIILLFLRENMPNAIIYCMLLLFLIFACVYIYGTDSGMLKDVLSYKVFTELGDISLEFYLLHMPILNFWIRLKYYFPSHIGDVETVFFSFIMTYVLALICKNNTRRKHV